MRKDMDKILVTTPRIGSSRKNGEVRRQRKLNKKGEYDMLPSYSSMRPKDRSWYGRKELNEYLNPLTRFLEKSCGRRWDDVYSDICKNMDKRSTIKAHIFQHLFDFVHTKPIVKDGSPHVNGWGGLRPLYDTGYTFYVDSKGFLRKPKDRWSAPDRKESANIIKVDSFHFYLKREDDGVWFEARFVDRPDSDLSFYENPQWVSNLFQSHYSSTPFNQTVARIGAKKVLLKTLSKRQKKALKISR